MENNIYIEDIDLKEAFFYIEAQVKNNQQNFKLQKAEIIFSDYNKVHKIIFHFLKNDKEVVMENYIEMNNGIKTVIFNTV